MECPVLPYYNRKHNWEQIFHKIKHTPTKQTLGGLDHVGEVFLKTRYKDLSTSFPIPQPPPISLTALKTGLYKEIPEAWAFY